MGTQEGENGGDSAAPTDQVKGDNLYENRTGAKKIIRVITVMAYMVSVSFVAMVLSGYYVFLWQPPNPRLLHRAQQRTDPRIEYRVDDEPASGAIGTPDRLVEEQNFRYRFSNMSGVTRPYDINKEARNSSLKETQYQLNPNKTDANDSRISSASWNPIVRRVIAVAHISSRVDEARGHSLNRNFNDSSTINDLKNSQSYNGSHHFSEQLDFGRNLTAMSSSPRPSGAVTTKTGSPQATEFITEATFGNDVPASTRFDENSLQVMTSISSRAAVPNDNITDHRIVIETTTNGTTENYDIPTAKYGTSGAYEIREERTIEKMNEEPKGRVRV